MQGNGRRRRRRLDAATRRAQIVAAASAVLEGRDAYDVTFDEVAAAAGVSRALVYNYFRDKGELIAAVYLRSLQRLDDVLQDTGGGPMMADDRIPIVVRTWLRFAEQDPEAFRSLVDSENAHHPVVQEARRERLEAMADTWGGTPEARVMASAVMGLLEAAASEWLEYQDAGRSLDAADLDRVADVLVTVLRDGLPAANRTDLPG